MMQQNTQNRQNSQNTQNGQNQNGQDYNDAAHSSLSGGANVAGPVSGPNLSPGRGRDSQLSQHNSQPYQNSQNSQKSPQKSPQNSPRVQMARMGVLEKQKRLRAQLERGGSASASRLSDLPQPPRSLNNTLQSTVELHKKQYVRDM